MAQVLHVDGRVEDVAPPADGVGYTLEEIKGALGISESRPIEQLPLNGLSANAVMLFDEEGKLVDLPINRTATAVARMAKAIWPNDYIVGPAIVVRVEDDGWTSMPEPLSVSIADLVE